MLISNRWSANLCLFSQDEEIGEREREGWNGRGGGKVNTESDAGENRADGQRERGREGSLVMNAPE